MVQEPEGNNAIEQLSGPFVSLATWCDRVLEGKDGTVSVIRMVDRVTQTATGSGTPEQMPPLEIRDLTLALGFKSGYARGRSEVTLRLEDPRGLAQDLPFALPLLFEGEERGSNLFLNLQFRAELEGLYWIDVLVDKRPVTRVPLRVLYVRQEVGLGRP